MGVATRPPVLDTGEDAREHCKYTGTVGLTTGVNIAFQVYELKRQQDVQVGAGVNVASTSGQTDKVIMIMGFAATGRAWLPTLKALFSRGDKAAGVEVAVFDNRGIGSSSVPERKEAYTTDLMAQDALGLMDHLGWRVAHVVGHSMGGMIAARLALAAPERVASLTLISVTGGGTEAIPLNATALRAGLRGSLNKGDPRVRASVDLTFHFSRQLLQSKDPESGRRVKDVLIDEYMAYTKTHGTQSKAGEEGHVNAVMKHCIRGRERRRLAAAGFPIKVIHGAADILALPRHAARLAAQLAAPLIMIADSAHFTPRDAAEQVVDELLASIEAVRRGATHADTAHAAADPAAYMRAGCMCCA